jgi:hypothetical protein
MSKMRLDGSALPSRLTQITRPDTCWFWCVSRLKGTIRTIAKNLGSLGSSRGVCNRKWSSPKGPLLG